MDHPARQMDRMYRHMRYVYDLSRKFYLLGRDRLIADMEVAPLDYVLEVGCGTARNLIKLRRKEPSLALFGLDASEEMLKTARQNVSRAGLSAQVALRQGLAEHLDPRRQFGLERPFDVVFFSYALSMIPAWKEALEAALVHLKPGGRLYIVDFGDHGDLPAWFARLQKRWLATFHVQYRPELLDYLRALMARDGFEGSIAPVNRRYAFTATLVKPR